MSGNESALQAEALAMARQAAAAPFESDPVMRNMVEEILALSPLERIQLLDETLASHETHKPTTRPQPIKREWQSDPELRAQTDRILSMPVIDRLRQLEAEANFFRAVRPVED